MRSFLPRRVELRHRDWLTTCYWHLIKTFVGCWPKNNHPGRAPGATTRNRCTAQRLHSPTTDLNFPHLASSKKSNEATVRRPKRMEGFFGSGQRLRSNRVKGANPQETLT